MKTIIVNRMPILFLVILLGFWASVVPNKVMAVDNIPAVIAVKFHADWCGSCKAMGSVFEELQAKYDTQPVLFVVLDQTREFNRQQSGYLAASLGLDKIWEKNGGKTGFIMLIDGKTREHIVTLTKEQDLKQMGASLMQAVDKVSPNR